MLETPKGLRKHIALIGRCNAGKSSILNSLAGQDAAIVSSRPGTTTDPVEKTMEIAGIGPVVLVDTPGIDDGGELGGKRVGRAHDILRRVDMAILVTAENTWAGPELELGRQLEALHIPFVIARNKIDLAGECGADWEFPPNIPVAGVSAKTGAGLEELVGHLVKIHESASVADAPLLADLLPDNGLAVLVVPLDSGAPRGRLILPQVQAIRDLLDGEKMCLVVTADRFAAGLARLAASPDLIVCDSQVVKRVAGQAPPGMPLTTFSILMARFKGNLEALARGAAALPKLRPGDAVLIQEACSHHPQAEDIGRVKIPGMLRALAGGGLDIRFSQGKEFSDYAPDLKAVIHCGACVITRTQMLARQNAAEKAGCPMTNYGLAISLAQGVLARTLAPFPEALAAFKGSAPGILHPACQAGPCSPDRLNRSKS